MMLPRVLWLCFLICPRRHFAILRHLIPNRFVATASLETAVEEVDVLRCVDKEMGGFYKKFWHVRSLLVKSLTLAEDPAEWHGFPDVWKVLVRYASIGACADL